MKRIGLILAIAAMGAVACNDRGETGAVGTSGNTPVVEKPATPAVTDADRDFVRDFTMANMAEVELGKLGVERGTNAEVKKFAQMMIDDHSHAESKLSEVAAQHGIAVPTAIDQQHRDDYDKLTPLKGPEFDRDFMTMMVNGHEDALSKLESRIDGATLADWKAKIGDTLGTKAPQDREPPPVKAETSDNPATLALNQWAAAAYPTVFHHTESAKAINNKLSKAPKTTH